MATSTKIAHCPTTPPVRVPHLMPFHIQYSGSAPVSTYFRIHPASLPESHPCPPPSVVVEAQLVSTASTEDKEDTPTVTAVATATALATTTSSLTDPVIKLPSSQPLRPGPIERLSGSAKRFISSFRGRTVHGVEVPLPKGYSGLVLRGDAEGRTQSTTGSKAKRRPARKPRSQLPEEVPEDDKDMEGTLPPEEERPVRILKPSARFDSFVLWHPDIPVDEEMDEYLRSLSEWVNIASEIHQTEPLPAQ